MFFVMKFVGHRNSEKVKDVNNVINFKYTISNAHTPLYNYTQSNIRISCSSVVECSVVVVAAVYTCSDVQTLGDSATSLSATDIANMDSSEFQDCLETFGEISDWDSDQLSALTDQAKTVRDSTHQISSTNNHETVFTWCLAHC